jgi:hypothetical protein
MMLKSSKNETGFLSILYAIGNKPLAGWDLSVKNGHIKRLIDPDIESPAIEIIGANVNMNYISIPEDPSETLNIKMPTLVLLMKHLRKYFAFEVTVLDDKKVKRVFRASNFQVKRQFFKKIF